MPDDFQNNERSYLRSMNTLGDALRFKNGKVSEDGTGDKLQDGEIRELDSFGGWTAIAGKDGRPGKFVIGKKNADGYFTGWYKKEDGTIEQGGMLGADALDNIFVHEQALDRRLNTCLCLLKDVHELIVTRRFQIIRSMIHVLKMNVLIRTPPNLRISHF